MHTYGNGLILFGEMGEVWHQNQCCCGRLLSASARNEWGSDRCTAPNTIQGGLVVAINDGQRGYGRCINPRQASMPSRIKCLHNNQLVIIGSNINIMCVMADGSGVAVVAVCGVVGVAAAVGRWRRQPVRRCILFYLLISR